MMYIYFSPLLSSLVSVCMCVWLLIEASMFLCVWCSYGFLGFRTEREGAHGRSWWHRLRAVEDTRLDGFQAHSLGESVPVFLYWESRHSLYMSNFFFLLICLFLTIDSSHMAINVNHRKTLTELSVVLKVHICSFWISRTISSIFRNMRRTLKTWTA
jgi:hypothetical protein